MPARHRGRARSSRCAASPSASRASWPSTTSTSRLRAGEVHALMGENGAGKSTLIKALTGVYSDRRRRDHGRRRAARLRHAPPTPRTPGISTVYQEVNLCPNLSVGENVMLGHEPQQRRRHRLEGASISEAARHLESLGLQLDTRSMLSSHSIAVQQLVAISRAMVLDARVLILDEPTSSLDRDEVEQLFAVIRDLRDKGVAILFVSHFLDQVYEISDRITVLRNGQLVGEYLIAGPAARRSSSTKMIGRELDELEAISRRRRAQRSTAPARRSCGRRASAAAACSSRPTSTCYDGEVVGIAGLLGLGPHRARPPALRRRPRRRRTDRDQRRRPSRCRRPAHAIEHRIAFSSEDRRAEGIIADLTVAENIVLGIQARRGWLRRIRERRAGRRGRRVHRRPSACARPTRRCSPATCPAATSRRSLLARWLATAPAAAHPRRADPRHRRRREGRHPAQGRRALASRDSPSSSSPPSSRRCFDWRSASW